MVLELYYYHSFLWRRSYASMAGVAWNLERTLKMGIFSLSTMVPQYNKTQEQILGGKPGID